MFGKTPLKAQTHYVLKIWGGMAPLIPLATPVIVRNQQVNYTDQNDKYAEVFGEGEAKQD